VEDHTKGQGTADLSNAPVEPNADLCGLRGGGPSTHPIKRLPNNMLLCTFHIEETRYDIAQHRCRECNRPHALEDADPMEKCQMCETMPSPGLRCLACDVALHPQWPAVYCSSDCALDDA
jgi:hypothetical protein